MEADSDDERLPGNPSSSHGGDSTQEGYGGAAAKRKSSRYKTAESKEKNRLAQQRFRDRWGGCEIGGEGHSLH